MTSENRTWRELCEAASQESDPVQLMELVAELMKALDRIDQTPKLDAYQHNVGHPRNVA